MKIEYCENNSHGHYRLTSEHWANLAKNGWLVPALGKVAFRGGLCYNEAVAEWERITGHDASDPGCECCGNPHTFFIHD